ncbi:hypothetical protein BGZ74_007563 [Mortierella antarctica]|uniref:DUF1754-domain-containing protein n=1 Tax=Podila minutissima TaxID=64525 RepID=A0A9P5SFE6_9FUNG|nr:hypothetical protein BGZ74_007563 [Mortierella antarctica]KAF9325602.1 hypothetical protein BG006_010900 [Podila minutissima]
MDYENVAGGTLKFKGGGSISKKKKKKTDASKVKAALDSESPTAKPVKLIEKTAAELKFEEVQKKRQEEKVHKQAMKSHKEKVAELNRKLEEMTEHYDIPKVGPG